MTYLEEFGQKVHDHLQKLRKDQMGIPTLYSVWVHTNGNKYVVVDFTNLDADPSRHDKYPPTIVYRNVYDGKKWSRPISDWHRSMTRVS